MMREVILAASARRDFIGITDYLFEEFGAVGLQRFLVRFEDIRKNLLDNPKIYKVAFKRQNIRKCVLARRCVIYFKIHGDIVEIVAIFDTRQAPEKLQKRLNTK